MGFIAVGGALRRLPEFFPSDLGAPNASCTQASLCLPGWGELRGSPSKMRTFGAGACFPSGIG